MLWRNKRRSLVRLIHSEIRVGFVVDEVVVVATASLVVDVAFLVVRLCPVCAWLGKEKGLG